MADDGTPAPAATAHGQDTRLKTFLASALFVVPCFAWQAWVLGTSFGQRRGKLVADANAFAQTRVAQAALAAQRREAGEDADGAAGDAAAETPAEHAQPGRSRPLLLVLGIGLLFLFARSWLARVLAVVPEAYLDEIFHIPQAQTYCAGRYGDWDDKITTPPGLYLVSLLLRPLWGGAVDGCSVWALRGANNIAILLVAIVACSCRAALERQDQQRRRWQRRRRQPGGQSDRPLAPLPESIFSLYAFHTALNVALVPVLFFFSALYYTDVYATLSALLAYRWYLFRQKDQYVQPAAPGGSIGNGAPPQWTGLVTVVLGLVALLFRQTNIFWVAVYLGGLEGVQAVKAVRQRNAQALHAEQAAAAATTTTTTPWALVQRYARQYAMGAIHDPPVGDAWPDDWLLSLLSIGVAAICNPVSVLLRVWPYVTVLASFAAFGAWNGGVVLGDKANHVATVHLAQLLYIWPLFAFFSAPLFVAHALRDAGNVWARSVQAKEDRITEKQLAPVTQAAFPPVVPGTAAKTTVAQALLRLLHVVFVRKAYYALYLLAVFGSMEAIVHYNTIVHPFTLADNRHYMFYVFRYTIRRGALLRYALVPVYAVGAWACWRVLSGLNSNHDVVGTERNGTRDNRDFVNSPFVAFASIGDSSGAEAVAAKESSSRSRLSTKKPSKKTAKTARANKEETPTEGAGSPPPTPPIFLSFLDEDDDAAASAAQTGAATSTALLWLLASALSLSMAPLVEPRYFILPWVFWRLLVPAVPTVPMAAPPATATFLRRLGQKVDGRLVLETAWLVAVNVATMYVFLYRPYVWRDEDGHVLDQGRLQRFLW